MHEPQFVPARSALPICSTDTSACRRESRAAASSGRPRSTSRRSGPLSSAPFGARPARIASAIGVRRAFVGEQRREPGARRQRLRRRDEHARLQPIADDVRAAIAAAGGVRELDARRRAGRAARRPTADHDAGSCFAGELVAPVARAARHGASTSSRQRERLARQREAVPLRLVAAHAHGRVLELGLARDRVDGRRGSARRRARCSRTRCPSASARRSDPAPRCR